MKLKHILLFILLILTGTSAVKAWEWNFNPNEYQNSMISTVVLIDNNGNNYGSPDIEVLAFYGDQIRGVGKASWDDTDQQYVYYMNVHANPAENINVVFKAFYAATGEPVILDGEKVETGSVSVDTGGSLGKIDRPSQVQPGAELTLEAIRIDESVQTYSMDNQSKSFRINPIPAGVTGFKVTYEQNGKQVTPKLAGSYDVIISRPKDNTYQVYNRTLPSALVIGLSVPTVTWPTSVSSVTEGCKLSDVTFSGGSGSAEGSFAWSNPDYVFQGSGSYMMEMVFTPSNQNQYCQVRKAVQVTVTAITRTVVTVTATTPQTPTYSGDAKVFTFESNPSGLSDFTVTYKKGGETFTEVIDAGTYDVTVSRPQDATYKAVSQTFLGGLVIKQIEPVVTWPTKVTLVYGDKLSAAVLEGQSGEGTFTWKEDKTPSEESSFQETLVFTPTSPNYKTMEKDVSVTVKKRTDITISTDIQNRTYNEKGSTFDVNPTPSDVTGFKVAYSQNGTVVATPIDVGTYDVTVTREIDVDYSAFSQTIIDGLVIEPADIFEIINWPKSAKLAKGEPLSTAVLEDVSNEIEGTFSWASPDSMPENSSEQELVFTPKSGNYKTVKKDIQVNVVELKAITLDQTVQNAGSYDGKPKSFKITVTSEPKDLTGFTVKYIQKGTTLSGSPSNAGTYDVTVSRPQDDTYKAFSATIKGGLIIGKADYPADRIVWPQDLSLYEGKTLSTLVIPSSSEGSFAWETPNAVFEVGNRSANLIFTPSDKNYKEAVRSIPITVVEVPVVVTYKVLVREAKGGSFSVKKGTSVVFSGDMLEEGTVLTLEATPDKGYKLSHFLVNGNSQINNQVTVTGNLILEAVFIVDTPTGIEDIDNRIHYQTQSGILYVEVPTRMTVQVITLSGTVVYSEMITTGTQIGPLYKGIYLLQFIDKSGNRIVKKVRL